jgi:hypothetical protein
VQSCSWEELPPGFGTSDAASLFEAYAIPGFGETLRMIFDALTAASWSRFIRVGRS